MANWRKVHIGNEEWHWVVSKGCFGVVIREPNKGKCHTVLFCDIEPRPTLSGDPYMEYWDYENKYSVTPGKIKTYIENNLLIEKGT
jgi:hypothetical protein